MYSATSLSVWWLRGRRWERDEQRTYFVRKSDAWRGALPDAVLAASELRQSPSAVKARCSRHAESYESTQHEYQTPCLPNAPAIDSIISSLPPKIIAVDSLLLCREPSCNRVFFLSSHRVPSTVVMGQKSTGGAIFPTKLNSSRTSSIAATRAKRPERESKGNGKM